MPFQFYKRIRLGKGLRLNLSKSGIGLTLGGKGAHYTIHSSGRETRSVGIPGTGVYWRETRKIGRRRSKTRAPAEELLRDEPEGSPVAAQYLTGLRLADQGRDDEAIETLRGVVAARAEIPDGLSQRLPKGVEIAITPGVGVRVRHGHLAAALVLAELLQRTGRTDEAVQLLESLGAVQPSAFFALSLADLYAELGRWDDVLRVTEEFDTNADDATAQLLVLRARALRAKGLADGALEALREALRSKARDPDVLKEARYERALAYADAGQHARARKELEKLYAADAQYRDVAKRLGVR
jgi:tetratricopeptide (TPR) repeat protein